MQSLRSHWCSQNAQQVLIVTIIMNVLTLLVRKCEPRSIWTSVSSVKKDLSTLATRSNALMDGIYVRHALLVVIMSNMNDRHSVIYLTNRPVPSRIQNKRGYGHNDKGEYFCPKCGNPIQIIDDDHGNTFRRCPDCNLNFDAKPWWFLQLILPYFIRNPT